MYSAFDRLNELPTNARLAWLKLYRTWCESKDPDWVPARAAWYKIDKAAIAWLEAKDAKKAAATVEPPAPAA